MSSKENDLGSAIGGIIVLITVGIFFFQNHEVEQGREDYNKQWDSYEAQTQKIADELEQERSACEKKYDMYDTRLIDCYEQASKNRDMKSRNLKTPMP